MSGIQKRFGATIALGGVELGVAAGEVHALIGENGAGKSTLMKILSGALEADEGSIELDGARFAPAGPLGAREKGVLMIYQELNLAPDLTVEENLLLGAEAHRFGWLRRRENRDRARGVLAELHYGSLPLDAPVRRLSLAERQVVEIARALLFDARVVIMDEPTSSLTRKDVTELFEVIDRLRRRGVSIVYISHFLEECREIADRYTVLRDGRTVGTGSMADADEAFLVSLMVGRDISAIYPREPHELGEPVLDVRNLAGKKGPASVSFSLRRGEIMGIAGLVGAGRTETLRTLFGLDDVEEGEIFVLGRESTRRKPPGRLREGIGFLSESRKEEGLMLNRNVADNLTLSRLGPLAKFGLVSASRQRSEARRWIDHLEIKTQGPEQDIHQLSGGNQQKVALGRLLYHDAQILLLDEPTRGVDVGSKVQIYRIILDLAIAAKSIIFVSSYLPELLGFCDTIGVIYRGAMVAVRPADEWTEESILSAAIGQEKISSSD